VHVMVTYPPQASIMEFAGDPQAYRDQLGYFRGVEFIDKVRD